MTSKHRLRERNRELRKPRVDIYRMVERLVKEKSLLEDKVDDLTEEVERLEKVVEGFDKFTNIVIRDRNG